MLQDGDVIAFDYDLYVEGQDEVFDTTQKATAEKAGLVDPNAFYSPMHYRLGAGRLIKGLEEALRTIEVGKTTTVDLDVEHAYGPRDPKLIETLPIQEFKRNKIDPTPGLVITYKNRRGTVTTVGGGRIRVDFNHSLAGKKLRYVVILRSVAKTPEEKVRGIIQMSFPTSLAWNVNVAAKEATIDVPEAAKFDQNFLLAKLRIVSELRGLGIVKTVRFVESYALEDEKPASGPAVEAHAAGNP